MSNIAVIDLGTGNLRSVYQAVYTVMDRGDRVYVTDDPQDIKNADKIVFPGQGAIATCMVKMNTCSELLHEIRSSLKNKPFLGICIGLQALYARSDEGGGIEGLGTLSGEVKHFLNLAREDKKLSDRNTGQSLKIPHMGWNNVNQTQTHPLWCDIPDHARFYFVHSFCAVSDQDNQVYAKTDYGYSFTSAAGLDNLFAVQFHPEKSQDNGLKLLKNFIHWDGVN